MRPAPREVTGCVGFPYRSATELPYARSDRETLHNPTHVDLPTSRIDPDPTRSLARALLAVETPKARERKVAAGDRGNEGGRGKKKANPSETVSGGLGEGESLAHVGSAIGLSAPSTRKGIAVLEAVDADHLAAAHLATRAALRLAWSAATRIETLRRGPARDRQREALCDAEADLAEAFRVLAAARDHERDLANPVAPEDDDEDATND